ncbi:MAG: hypothetical protein ABI778_00180 [Ignavibacteriota bacterium]
MKKSKAVILLLVQLTLSLVLVIVMIEEPKSKLEQVEERYGVERSILRDKEARLRGLSIRLVQHPTSITIVETAKDKPANGSYNGLDMLSKADAEFLVDIASGAR